jgi:hypothetical protein
MLTLRNGSSNKGVRHCSRFLKNTKPRRVFVISSCERHCFSGPAVGNFHVHPRQQNGQTSRQANGQHQQQGNLHLLIRRRNIAPNPLPRRKRFPLNDGGSTSTVRLNVARLISSLHFAGRNFVDPRLQFAGRLKYFLLRNSQPAAWTPTWAYRIQCLS